jgi:hypothetical protein
VELLYQSDMGLPRPIKADHSMLVDMDDDANLQSRHDKEFHGFLLYYFEFHDRNPGYLTLESKTDNNIKWI